MKPELFRVFMEPRDIYDSMIPLIKMSYLIGLLPARVGVGPNGERALLFSFSRIIPTFAHFAIFTTCLIVSISKRQSIIGYFVQTSVAQFGDLLQLFTGTLSFFGIYAAFIWKWKSCAAAVEACYLSDKIFEKLGATFNNFNILKKVIIYVVFIAVLSVAFLTGCYWLLNEGTVEVDVVVYITFLLPHIPMTLTVFMMLVTVRVGLYRFRMANEVYRTRFIGPQSEKNA